MVLRTCFLSRLWTSLTTFIHEHSSCVSVFLAPGLTFFRKSFRCHSECLYFVTFHNLKKSCLFQVAVTWASYALKSILVFFYHLWQCCPWSSTPKYMYFQPFRLYISSKHDPSMWTSLLKQHSRHTQFDTCLLSDSPSIYLYILFFCFTFMSRSRSINQGVSNSNFVNLSSRLHA